MSLVISKLLHLSGCCLTLAIATAAPCAAAVLYTTSFDDFEVGADQLAQVGGWRASGRGQGLHGIDKDAIPGLGKSGFLGRSSPAADTSFVSVWRPLNYSPLAQEMPIIEFFAIVGVADSTNGARDNFYITLYDSGNQLLGAINFDNTNERYGIWRYDGQNYHRASGAFFRGKVHELYLRINFATGKWSAELDNLPLFRDAPIDFTGKTRTLGSFAAEWEISDAANPGNNWFLFDEWTIEGSPLPGLTAAFRAEPDFLNVRWNSAETGYAYRVQNSANLADWETIETITPIQRGESRLQIQPSERSGFYRVKRFIPLINAPSQP
ncbi:MAG: hypothetical protein ACI9R3_000293 [Verrucomicrobiales bacterium]|jgi:hypothetical protein